MHLNYNSPETDGKRNALVLLRHGTRIELHVKASGSGLFSIESFSGPDGKLPEKARSQGPFHSPEQAGAAIRAVASILRRDGFEVADDVPPIWGVAAQRQVREARSERAQVAGQYQFDPNDVYFDSFMPSGASPDEEE